MDVIKINDGSDQIQVIDQDDGIPVKVIEQTLSVSDKADVVSIKAEGDKIVFQDSSDTVAIKDTVETVPVKFSDVLIQRTYIEVDTELEMPYNQEVDFVGDTVIYKGWAATGSATSAAVWRIQRLTFVGADEDVSYHWADGDGNFDNVWDDRAGLSYS